jgi:hypothetical protein
LEALGTPRPVSVIQAEIKAFPIDWSLWKRSAQCEDATKPDTQTYCQPVIDLYKERGAAARKTELEPQVARLRDELAHTNRPEVATEQEAVIGGYWAWIMGVAVVFVATFGSVIFASPTNLSDETMPARRQIPVNAKPPKGSKRGRKANSRISDFSSAYAEKHGRPPSGSEIKAAFPECPKSTAYDYASRARA